MEWRNIPSLASLRAFEACARHESFSAAAAELNVTHAAISQHVRGLEKELSVPLLTKAGRGVALTAEGRSLSAALATGFAAIADGIDTLRAQEDGRPLHISLTPLFAENWLMPRLGDFWATHPEIPLALDPEQSVVDLSAGQTDLAIRYGEGDWPGAVSEMLTPVQFAVVGKPGLLPKGNGSKELREQRWFFEARRPEFRKWVEDRKMIGPDSRVEVLENTALTLAAARQGYGMAVHVRDLMQADIDAGLLQTYCEDAATSETTGYHMVRRMGDPSPRLRKLMAWLRKQAA